MDSATSSATSRKFERLRLHYGCRQESEVRRSIRQILQTRGIQSRGIDRHALRPSHCSEHGGDFNDIQFAYATRIYARFMDAGSSHRIPHCDSIRGLAPTRCEHSIEYRTCAEYNLAFLFVDTALVPKTPPLKRFSVHGSLYAKLDRQVIGSALWLES